MKKSLLFKFFRFLILFLLPVSVFAQTGSIKGKVADENGDPLIGVNIILKGTTVGSVSDLDGNYIITNLVLESTQLEVSFIGYINQTYTIDLAKTPNALQDIVLYEDVKELSEVVVIGYGTQKKSDLTSAVASVSAEDLEQSKAANIQEALQGRAAGVHVQTNTGAPGANVSIKIRGITSINGTDPIWIVDGVRADPKTVNAADIESMEILKDASSASIYGADGANGVILVTTKKGKAGETKVTFNAFSGIKNVSKTIPMASGPEFAEMYHEWEVLANKRKYYFSNPDTLPTYNYQDMIFRAAKMQNYNIGVSGGNEKSTFYMGIGYLEEEGIIESSDYKKLTVRLNSEHKANKWLSVGANASYTNQKYNGFEEWELTSEYATPILAAMNYHSFVEPYGEKTTDSEYDKGWSFTPLGNTNNPLATIDLKHREAISQEAKGSFFVAITPIDGFKMESRITGTASTNSNYNFSPIYYITSSNNNNNSKIYRGSGNYNGWNWQNIMSYNKTLFDLHNISLMAGFESSYDKTEWESAERWDLINQTPEMWYFDASLNDTLVIQVPSRSANEGAGYSYLGRVNYDYNGMFLGQFNIRKDYSSKFGPNYRSGVFPSFSAGFKFTELDIVRNTLPYLSFGKIRYGWGKAGNSAIDYYQYYSTIAYEDVYAYSYANSNVSSLGAAPDKFVNESVHWESVVTSNIGMDLTFLENKLSVTVDYFRRHNIDMLMRTPIPLMSGWNVSDSPQEGQPSLPTANVGEIKNSGFEFSTGWKEKKGKLNYGANFNITYLKTITGDINPDTLYAGETKGIGGYLTKTIYGQPVGEYHGYITDGLFRLADTPNGDASELVTNQPYTINPDGEIIYAQPKAHPGDIRFKDVNGDGKLDEKDVVAIGNPNPKFMFALNLFVEYGMFDAKIFLQGTAGNKVFNATKFYQYNTDGAFNWSKDYYDDHYTIDLVDRNGDVASVANDGATYPRVDPKNENGNFSTLSDFYIEDASYLRVKNVEVGFTLKREWTEVINIERARIYVGATNLFTFTKYSGFDPEVGSGETLVQGLDKAAYPSARMYTIGVNVNF